jgi:hypothetical protein
MANVERRIAHGLPSVVVAAISLVRLLLSFTTLPPLLPPRLLGFWRVFLHSGNVTNLGVSAPKLIG